MSLKYKYVAIAIVLVLVGIASIFLLLVNTSIPVFSVKELMDDPKAESYIGRRIQLVGVVNQVNDSGFILSDPEEANNSPYLIFVDSTNAEKPAGFEIGKTILVEGKLAFIGSMWIFKASKISTKCPSKYKTDSFAN